MIDFKLPFSQMVRKMTKRELLKELTGVVNQMAECSFGKYELYYREELERELDKRGIIPHLIYN